MNNSAVIMMLVAIVIIWGGLIASLVHLQNVMIEA